MKKIGKNALTNLKADLPYHAWGVYYTDDIGNVSTSHAYRDVLFIIIFIKYNFFY